MTELPTVPPATWQLDAACVGMPPELWAPHGIAGKLDYGDGRRICVTRCSVRDACLQFAEDEHLEYAMYGGLTPDERLERRREQRRARRRVQAS